MTVSISPDDVLAFMTKKDFVKIWIGTDSVKNTDLSETAGKAK